MYTRSSVLSASSLTCFSLRCHARSMTAHCAAAYGLHTSLALSLCHLHIGGPTGGPAGGPAGTVGRLSGASTSLLAREIGAGEDEERFGGVGDG